MKDQIGNINWITEKAKKFQKKKKKSTSASLNTSVFDCVDQNCGKFLKDGNIRPLYLPPEKPICRLRSSS